MNNLSDVNVAENKNELSEDTIVAEEKQDGKKKLSKKLITIIVVSVVVLAAVITLIAVFSLNDAEKSAVENVSFMIHNLPDNVSLDDGEEIIDAENAYNELSKKCRMHVDYYDKLKTAAAEYEVLLIENVEKNIDKIGTVTVDSGEYISKARLSYDNLSDEQKEKLKNGDVLISAENEYQTVKIKDAEQKIADIGEVSVSNACKIKINSATYAYDNLDDSAKKSVSNYSVLEAAVKKYNELAVAECKKLIDSIGTVTTASEEIINKARTAYDSLDESVQSEISNYSVLTQAEDTLKKAKLSFKRGDTLTNRQWEITLTKVQIAKSVYPNDRSGYYHYYTAPEDSDFIVLQFKIKNISDDTLNMDSFVGDYFDVEFMGKSVKKTAEVYYDDNDGWLHNVYSNTGLGAYDSVYINVCLNVPEEVEDSDEPVIVTGTFCGQEKSIKVK